MAFGSPFVLLLGSPLFHTDGQTSIPRATHASQGLVDLSKGLDNTPKVLSLKKWVRGEAPNSEHSPD